MKFRRCLSVLSTGLMLGSTFAVGANAAEVWKIDNGRTSIHFYDNLLADLGLRVDHVNQTADQPAASDVQMEGPYVSFSIADMSDMQYQVNRDRFVPYGVVEGSIAHSGGFTITDVATGVSRTINDFHIVHNVMSASGDADTQRPYSITDAAGEALTLSHPGTRFADGMLRIGAMTLDIPEALAAEFNRPELAMQPIGLLTVEGASVKLGGVSDAPDAPSERGGVLDVKLGLLNGLRSYGHEGTYPTGQSGLACATTSCNPGDLEADWYAPMQERHPAIGMHLYRMMDGRFEQIGVSWLKHGFFALSNNQCGDPRGCDGTDGTRLGVGCSDTYSAGLNADRYYLGPREEWNPYTGYWVCNGSFFAHGEPDCVRRENGSGWGPTDHRLLVQDADLDLAGADYFYDAYYIVQDEEVHFNNVGWRPVTMSWSSGNNRWNFSESGSNFPTEGPPLLMWGNVQDTVAPAGDGEFVVSSKATDNLDGTWRYEFAVYNFWSHKATSTFRIPVADDAVITDLYFHDWDNDGSNDWTGSATAGLVTWSGDNPIEWAIQANFGFTANKPPATSVAQIVTHREPGGETVDVQVETTSGVVAVGDPSVTPSIAQLGAAVPNPVTKTAAIGFELTKQANIAIEIFSADGRLVKTIANGTHSVGAHTANWDGTDLLSRRVGAGVYYYRLKVDGRLDAARSLVVVD